MALFASWAHGSISGCLEYTGNAGDVGDVLLPLPTPVIVGNNRARLLRVFVLYSLDAGVVLGPVSVLDGPNAPGKFDPNSTGQNTFSVSVPGPRDVTGVNGFGDLIDDVTRFNFRSKQPLVFFGLALLVRLQFSAPGKARFTSVGADFDV